MNIDDRIRVGVGTAAIVNRDGRIDFEAAVPLPGVALPNLPQGDAQFRETLATEVTLV
jgi:hypothetical protein